MNPASASPRGVGAAFTAAVVAFAWWRISENTADNDLWGHVLYGQRMLHLGGLEHTDTLSWTAAGAPWINHEVLAELLLGFTHQVGGAMGLWVLMVALAGLTITWAWREGAGRDPGQRLAALALLALTTNAIALGCSARPQLFTFLFFVALLAVLRRFLNGSVRWGWAVPALLAVWVNCHGGFLAGWLITLVAVAAEALAGLNPALTARARAVPGEHPARILALLVATSTAALLCNPWGWELVTWTLATVRLPRPDIPEWQPPPVALASLPFYGAIAVGIFAWGSSRQSRRLWEMVVWALCALLAIRHQRHAPLLGLASLVFLPVHLHDAAKRWSDRTTNLRAALVRPVNAMFMAAALVASAGACVLASLYGGRGDPWRMAVPRDLYPEAAIAFMREQRLAGPTITFFDWGQQVLWELPRNPVSFDGRLDTVYSAAIMDAHWRLYAGQEPGRGLDLSRAEFALLPTDSGGTRVLLRRGWREIYRDPLAAVLVRRAAALPPGFRPVAAGPEAVAGRAVFPDQPAALAAAPARPHPAP